MTGPDTSSGLRCPACQATHEWRDLTSTIISDGEGGLVWVWSCAEGEELRREPFAFPTDFTSSQPDAESPSVEMGGIDARTEP